MSRGPTGVDDQRRQMVLPDHRQDPLFREVFGALVRTDESRFGDRRGFVARRSVGGQAERGDAAGVHDALDPRCERRPHDCLRALDIDAHHVLRVRDPEPVIGRDMKEMAATGDGAAERIGIRQVPLDGRDRQPCEVLPVGAAADQDSHRVPARQESARHRRSDEPAGAGHQGGAGGLQGLGKLRIVGAGCVPADRRCIPSNGNFLKRRIGCRASRLWCGPVA
jgi:hypothetical protein